MGSVEIPETDIRKTQEKKKKRVLSIFDQARSSFARKKIEGFALRDHGGKTKEWKQKGEKKNF